jgi:hypothetical protein
MTSALDAEVVQRTVNLIRSKYGSLAHLPAELQHTVWVTVYRACEISMKVEQAGGSRAITKSMLLGDGRDAFELDSATRKLDLLQKMLPIVRTEPPGAREAAAQLVVDMLKWGMVDAPNTPALKRAIGRGFAKADSLY